MRTARYAFLAAAFLAISCSPAKPTNADATPDEIRSNYKHLVTTIAPLAKSPFGTGAVATSLIDGVANTAPLGTVFDGGPAVGAETRFNVASVSKVLTAARIVSLAHAKAIDLDAPVSAYLPGVKLLDKGVDRAGTITVRQLVEHRSGLPHVPKDLEQKVAGRWSSPDLLRLLTDSWELPLAGPPGQYLYSNTGYALLAAIVERTATVDARRYCSFADCMASYLRELGMPHSTFWPATLDENAAHGRVVIDGVPSFHAPGWYGSRYALPFSGLWTSMPDLAHFGALLVAAAHDPGSPLHGMTAMEGGTLGLFRNKRVLASGVTAPTLEHDGSGPGFYAALVVVPSTGLVLAVATNGGNESKAEATTFGTIVADAVRAAR
jgi:CubicO group peptidase (beta-lactamase class C family)